MKNFLLCLFLCLLFSCVDKDLKQANELYKENKCKDAILFYDVVLKKNNKNKEALIKKQECINKIKEEEIKQNEIIRKSKYDNSIKTAHNKFNESNYSGSYLAYKEAQKYGKLEQNDTNNFIKTLKNVSKSNFNQGKYDEAQKNFEELLEISNDDEIKILFEKILYQKATSYYKAKNYKLSLESYEKLKNLNPNVKNIDNIIKDVEDRKNVLEEGNIISNSSWYMTKQQVINAEGANYDENKEGYLIYKDKNMGYATFESVWFCFYQNELYLIILSKDSVDDNYHSYMKEHITSVFGKPVINSLYSWKDPYDKQVYEGTDSETSAFLSGKFNINSEWNSKTTNVTLEYYVHNFKSAIDIRYKNIHLFNKKNGL